MLDLKDNNWGRSRSSNAPTPEDSYQQNYQQAANFTQVLLIQQSYFTTKWFEGITKAVLEAEL